MPHHRNRVVADGWGEQSTGSVFCADSNLRYFYESNTSARPQGPIAPCVYSAATSANGTLVNGTRTTSVYPDVDLVEAEIARACAVLAKEATAFMSSFHECIVCLTSNAFAEIAACGHTFHPQCFLRWYRVNRSCPMCRGRVDRIQVAQSINGTAQDQDLEAMMAEIDHESLQLLTLKRSESESTDDHLLTTSDQFMALLETDFDTDMDFVALDELNTELPTCRAFELEIKRQADVNMDIEMEQVVDDDGYKRQGMTTSGIENEVNALAMTPQYPPVSAMPNYWNVLNQGMVSSSMPLAPMVLSQKIVQIAPKPEPKTLRSRVVQTTQQMPMPHSPQQKEKYHQHDEVRASSTVAPHVVSCRCTGGCRNGRCACVKEGGMCGASCRCTSCKNPFSMVKTAGADIDALLKDDCFMHNVSKTRDMMERLQEVVLVPCCEGTIKVVDCVQGFTCKLCKRQYDFSWCMNKLLVRERTPRNHCAICKRCCDHRDVHCHNCGRCYFAGVAASLPCPCKEATSHRKRREAATKDKAEEPEEEAEGECCIM